MNKLGKLFTDDYNFETLVVPAMVIAIPIMAVVALFGINVSWLVGFAVLGVELVLFPLWLMATWIRDAGTKLQLVIFPDGMPTHVALRLRDGTDYEKKVRRSQLEKVTGVELAAAEDEELDPGEADARIKHALTVAREKMRDKRKFLLLRRELKSYGFWRNMAAAKPIGVLSAIACTMMLVWAAVGLEKKGLPLGALACSMIMLMYWLVAVNNKRVKNAAERYKVQFFNSLGTL